MDGNQFDDISRKLAGRTTRRDAVRSGGIMAAVAGAFGVRSIAHAQDDDEEPTTDCDWGFRALVVDGPNKDATYEGLLKIAIERDGAIDDASLETGDAEPLRVVGYIRGKSISLRIIITKDEQELACTGVGSRDIRSCAGRISGTMAGPEFGDIGVWEVVRHVQPGDTGDGTPVASATVAGGGGPSQPTPGSGNPNPTSTPGATSTPCTPQDCGVTKMWDPQQCMCVCYDNGVDCGPDTCCPQGSICESGGGCACPAGTVICGSACVAECPSGSTLDYNTCTCAQGCGVGQVLCNGNCVNQCASGETLNTTTCTCENLCPPGQKFCGSGCIDVTNDTSNCGSCGNVCQPGMPCIAGTCTCPATMKYCASSQSCIDQNAACA